MTTIDMPVSELTAAAYRAVELFAQLDPPLTYDAIGEQVGKGEREVRTIIGVACNGNRAKAREYIRTHAAPESPLTAPIRKTEPKVRKTDLRTEAETRLARPAPVVEHLDEAPAPAATERVWTPPDVDESDLVELYDIVRAALLIDYLTEKANAVLDSIRELKGDVLGYRRCRATDARIAELKAEIDALEKWRNG